ncbi:MAG: dephospho-CoA kinase [Gemmatimonadales bacterium]|nr:dephospho-CoA kinase [Gemmatimonadales bacterium]
MPCPAWTRIRPCSSSALPRAESGNDTPAARAVRHVALTGNIASGKSAVADLFRRWGAVIVDADALVREAQAPGSPVLAAIAARFGRDILAADGTLDRARLRSIVFSDAVARADLEAIVHPEVRRRQAQMLAAAREAGIPLVVSDIPLLFETGALDGYDAIVLVDAAESIRRDRLVRNRGLSGDEADRLIAAQMPVSAKRERSTYVIQNDTDRDALEHRARTVWQALTRA